MTINRRMFLAALGSLAITKSLPAMPRAAMPLGYIRGTTSNLSSFYSQSNLDGFGKNKQAFLCNAYRKVTKQSWKTRLQFKGDCVGVAVATATDYVTVTQTLQRRSRWLGRHSIIPPYVGGRQAAGLSPIGNGARAEWLISWLQEYGSLLERVYGQDDLTQWDQETYNHYRNGLTGNLLIRSRLHPLVHQERVSSYLETRDAIASGHPVILCSSMGVSYAKKDKDGFFKPRGYTPHAMCCIGVDDKDRKSILIQNSHGVRWAPGPKRYGFEPEGSAWVDADIFDYYIKQFDDSFTMSLFKGYTVKRKYILW